MKATEVAAKLKFTGGIFEGIKLYTYWFLSKEVLDEIAGGNISIIEAAKQGMKDSIDDMDFIEGAKIFRERLEMMEEDGEEEKS